jgi:hypothetical protein
MWLVKSVVSRHYHGKVEELVFANLSRLAAQWQQIVNSSLSALE